MLNYKLDFFNFMEYVIIMKNVLKEILTSSKTNRLSSMRIIALIGTIIFSLCLLFMVITNSNNLEHVGSAFVFGIVGLAGAKSFQTGRE